MNRIQNLVFWIFLYDSLSIKNERTYLILLLSKLRKSFHYSLNFWAIIDFSDYFMIC